MSRKKITLEFNSQIKNIFRSKNISAHDGVSYLLCLHFGTDPSFIPMELERKVLASGIVTKDYGTGVVKWIIPLFEEAESGFEWISDWMDMFKEINPERRGTKRDVLRRMKKFFVNNPAIRKDEVIAATRNYLKGVDNPKYCKKSHKFIYEQDGNSMLEDYVEQLSVTQERAIRYNDDII